MPIATAVMIIVIVVYIFLLAMGRAGRWLKTRALSAAKQMLTFRFAPRGHAD